MDADDYPRDGITNAAMSRPDLTAAFHDPRLLRGSNFAYLNERFILTADSRHAILINMTLSKATVFSVLIAIVLLSAVIGVGAGLFGVTAAIVGILAVFQMAILGMDSLRDK